MPQNNDEFTMKVLLLLNEPTFYPFTNEEEGAPGNPYDELAYGSDFEEGE